MSEVDTAHIFSSAADTTADAVEQFLRHALKEGGVEAYDAIKKKISQFLNSEKINIHSQRLQKLKTMLH